MLLGDLLADSSLGLALLAGEDQLHRPVRGVYITDLIDPSRYLHGGELVLSGLVWRSCPEDSEKFVAALVEAGVAGLAAGTARFGHVPADLFEACRRNGLPVFEVPIAVSFNTLAERVQRQFAPRRELVAAVASGTGLEQLVQLAEAELGAACWVLAATGWVVAAAGELPEPARRAAVSELVGSAALPRVVRAGEKYVLWPVTSDVEPRAARWAILVRGDLAEWSAAQEAIAADFSTAVAVVRARVEQARQIAGRAVETALRRLADRRLAPGEVTARLESAGLPTDQPLRVVTLRLGEAASAAALLREIAAATGLPAVVAAQEDSATALFAGAPGELDGLGQRLREIVDAVAAGLDGQQLAVGISDTTGAAGLPGAVEEAGYACQLAARRGTSTGVADSAELASHEVLLAAVPDGLRESYRERVLGRLVDYDREHRSDLVGTLRAFLACAGSWSRCAQQLHVHVNTLRYRLRRIEEITGRDLSSFAARVDFYLALELDRGSGERPVKRRSS